MQRASTMLMPASAKVRDRSSSRRWRSQPSTWSSTLNAVSCSPSQGTAHEALGVLAQRGDVRAVVAVDRDAAAERDVADDRVAGHRAAALGQAQHARRRRPRRGCRSALDVPVGWRRCAARSETSDSAALGLVLGGLALLEALHDLVDDDLRRDLRPAERDVEVVGLAEAHLADHVGQQRRADDLLRRQALLVAGAPAAARGRRARCPRATPALNHCLILLRARVVLTSASQSRDGPRSRLEVRTSTMSPRLQLRSAAARSCR